MKPGLELLVPNLTVLVQAWLTCWSKFSVKMFHKLDKEGSLPVKQPLSWKKSCDRLAVKTMRSSTYRNRKLLIAAEDAV